VSLAVSTINVGVIDTPVAVSDGVFNPTFVGAVVSTITDKLPVAEDWLPAVSVAFALIEYVPAVKLRSIV
jgi:hypothetical protein